MRRVASLVIGASLSCARHRGGIGARHGLWVSRDHPAIQYSSRPPRDAIVTLNESIQKGDVTLAFDAMPRGYLAVGAEGARHSTLVPDAGVLREQPAARAHQQGARRARSISTTRSLLRGRRAQTRSRRRRSTRRRAFTSTRYRRRADRSRSSFAAMPTACSATCCRRRTACPAC